MSDKIRGFIVTFKEDVREEYAEKVKESLYLINGVASVDPVITDFKDLMATQQAKREIIDKFWDLLK